MGMLERFPYDGPKIPEIELVDCIACGKQQVATL
jgi:hypothetical protein